MLEALKVAISATGRLGSRLMQLDLRLFVVLIAAVTALKTTFFWRGSFFYQEAEAFPEPVTHFSNNFLAVVIHRSAGDHISAWFLGLSLTALAAAVICFIYFLSRETSSPEDRRIIIILAFSWPAVLVVLPWIGNGTAFLPLFLLLGILAKRLWLRLVGIVLAVATHPEHTLVGLLLLLILSLGSEFRHFRPAALQGFVVALLGTGLSTLWLYSQASPSRLGALSSGADFAFPFALRYGALGVYTWWGMWWIVVAIAFTLVGKRTRWVLALVGIIVPGIFTSITADYTRVFVGITIPISLALATLLFQSRAAPNSDDGRAIGSQPGLALGAWFLALILLPNLIFMMPGDGVPLPGNYWMGLVENYVFPLVQ